MATVVVHTPSPALRTTEAEVALTPKVSDYKDCDAGIWRMNCVSTNTYVLVLGDPDILQADLQLCTVRNEGSKTLSAVVCRADHYSCILRLPVRKVNMPCWLVQLGNNYLAHNACPYTLADMRQMTELFQVASDALMCRKKPLGPISDTWRVLLQLGGMSKKPSGNVETGVNVEHSKIERYVGWLKSSGPSSRTGSAMLELTTSHEFVIPSVLGTWNRSDSV